MVNHRFEGATCKEIICLMCVLWMDHMQNNNYANHTLIAFFLVSVDQRSFGNL